MAVFEELSSPTPPWVYLVVVPPGKKVESVIEAPPGFAVRITDGRRCRTKQALLEELARALEFPAGSGRNWDALEELLTDLEWLPARGYILVVSHADQLLVESPEEHGDFIDVMESVGKAWATPQRGEWPRPAMPFHTCLVVTKGREGARSDWRVPRLSPQRRAR